MEVKTVIHKKNIAKAFSSLVGMDKNRGYSLMPCTVSFIVFKLVNEIAHFLKYFFGEYSVIRALEIIVMMMCVKFWVIFCYYFCQNKSIIIDDDFYRHLLIKQYSHVVFNSIDHSNIVGYCNEFLNLPLALLLLICS